MSGRTQRRSVGRLIAIEVDEGSIAAPRAFMSEERAAAIRDLVAGNLFAPVGRQGEVFHLRLSLIDNRLVFDVGDDGGVPVVRHVLSLAPLRRVIKDYFLIVDSYNEAVRSTSPVQIEAIDVGRRGLHDEGAAILRERLEGKIAVDHATARRLFTLVCTLHWKG